MSDSLANVVYQTMSTRMIFGLAGLLCALVVGLHGFAEYPAKSKNAAHIIETAGIQPR